MRPFYRQLVYVKVVHDKYKDLYIYRCIYRNEYPKVVGDIYKDGDMHIYRCIDLYRNKYVKGVLCKSRP